MATTSSTSRIANHLANERTFLAWLRTAIAMMGFGIVMVRLRVSPAASISPPASSAPLHITHLGLLFAVIGLAMVLFGLCNYEATRRAIESDKPRANNTGIVLFAIAVVLLGVGVIVYLLGVLFSRAPSPPF